MGNTTHSLTYDAIGNPLTYGNGQQLYTNLTWEHGRQLASLTTNGKTCTYDYDADGIRTGKVIDGVVHTYITQNGRVVRETIGTGSTAKILDFIYDTSGRPFALNYSTDNGSSFQTYYYILNLQGDVVKLVEILSHDTGISSFAIIANYTYNAWGTLRSVTGQSGNNISDPNHIANLNPLRYRGYYYDTETGFYYLQSRYYDPANRRFINADSFASTGQGFVGTNMFAYCNNCPVIYFDPSGNRFISSSERYYGNGLYAYTDAGGGRYAGQANCYAFAFKMSKDPRTNDVFLQKPQPGEFSDKLYTTRMSEIAGEHDGRITEAQIRDAILNSVVADGEVLGFSFEEVSSADYVPNNGQWVVALAFDYSPPIFQILGLPLVDKNARWYMAAQARFVTNQYS